MRTPPTRLVRRKQRIEGSALDRDAPVDSAKLKRAYERVRLMQAVLRDRFTAAFYDMRELKLAELAEVANSTTTHWIDATCAKACVYAYNNPKFLPELRLMMMGPDQKQIQMGGSVEHQVKHPLSQMPADELLKVYNHIKTQAEEKEERCLNQAPTSSTAESSVCLPADSQPTSDTPS